MELLRLSAFWGLILGATWSAPALLAEGRMTQEAYASLDAAIADDPVVSPLGVKPKPEEIAELPWLTPVDVEGLEFPAHDALASAATNRRMIGVEEWTKQTLPSGLIFRSYLAAPRESRLSYAWLYDSKRETWVNESALGARVGLLRYGTEDPLTPEGWQLDVEAAAFPRLAEGSLDLLATDYRAGVPLTWRRGKVEAKAAFYHLSSHVGDELLITLNYDFNRINFSRNAIVLAGAYYPIESVRAYGELGYGFLNDGGNEPWEFQFGLEYLPAETTKGRGAPFVAANAHLREEVDFGGTFNLMAGWAWKGLLTGHQLRVGGQFMTGHSNQLEFLGLHEDLLGLGVWFDF